MAFKCIYGNYECNGCMKCENEQEYDEQYYVEKEEYELDAEFEEKNNKAWYKCT